jgi:hypothetical protein
MAAGPFSSSGRRLDPPTLRAAWWALRALATVRRGLRRHGVRDVALPEPPSLHHDAVRGVNAVLRRTRHSCLERSLVLQRWLAAHDDPRDVVIGVTASSGFRAHAWLDGEPEPGSPHFEELIRLSP